MRTVYWDLFILGCVYLDISLIIALVGESIDPSLNIFFLISIPLGFFVVTGCALLSNRLMVRRYTKKPVKIKSGFSIFGIRKKKKKNSEEEIKPVQTGKSKKRPSQTKGMPVEFATHVCPIHGVEKCAGNYLNMHSCNTNDEKTPKNQLFWEEPPKGARPSAPSTATAK